MLRFTFYDYFLAFISTCTYIADVASDIALLVYFFTEGHQVWGSLSLCFVALAALLMQVFSFHWHVSDRTLTVGSLFVHILFLAPLHRYFKVFQLGRKSRKSGNGEDLGAAYRAINDISILRLVETFIESAPQLVLQLYIVLSNLQNFNTLLGFSMVFSLFSVSWSITAYTDALHLAYKKFYKRSFVSMVTHLIWQTGMVTARVVSIVLFATVFHGYVGIPLGVHFVVMFVWIIKLQPDFGSTPCERRLFTVVAAAIHIFCFLNLKDGNSRYRMVFYYVLALIETAAYMTVWYMCKSHSGPIWFDVTAFSVVFGAFGLGTIFMLLYYGCCHPSGPAPIPSQKPDFLKPGNLAFGTALHQYKPSMASKKPQQDKPMKNTTSSKGNHPSIFDVSSTSARINLWLSASLDLSKEGLVEHPDCHLDPSLQPSGNQTINSQNQGGDISIQRKVSCRETSVDVHVSPLGSTGSNSAAKPLLGRSNYQEHGSYRERSASELNKTEDRMDFSRVSRASDREHSMPDYNLVEMFARCKLDPSFVSNSSISDILFNQTLKQNTPTSKNGKFSLSPENQYGRMEQNKSEMDISGSNWNQTRTSNDSSKSLIYSPNHLVLGELGPPSISPLDPSRLWEESEGRLRQTSFLNNTGSDPTLHQSGERNPVFKVTPDVLRGITCLSLSYSNLNSDNISPRQNKSNSKDNSGFSETANSFVFKNGVDKSIESLSGSSNLVNQSEMLSFSDVSLQLPDCSSNSRNRSDTQPDINRSTTPNLRDDIHKRKRSHGNYDSLKNSSSDKFSMSKSKDSYSSREYSPSDRQSSYLSDRGLASSDRGFSSSHSTNDASGHRSLTSSGFQSEESNMSTTSPAYSHFCDINASKFHSTPVVENEISSICPPSSVRAVTSKRVSLDDDIYADSSKFKNSTPVIDKNHHVYDKDLKDNITPITSIGPKKANVIMPPSSLFYENSNVDSPVLPPIGWSRRSSSAGSSGSGGRFFKDPTLSSNEDLNNKSGESKCTVSLVSQGSNNGYMEKSSLSALLSDMSSSKCTRTSEENFSMASDPDTLKRSYHSILSDNMIDRKTESLPYMPVNDGYSLNHSDNGLTASLPHQFYNMQGRRSLDKSQNSIHDYENINNYTKQSSNASNSSLNLSGSKTVSAYLYNNEPEKNRLQELYNEFSHASCVKNESDVNRTFDKDKIPNYENINELNDGNIADCIPESDSRSDMFSRDKWRASLDKEMKERLVHDIERLAPKKLYQLSTKNGPPKKKMSPVNITEYNDSPYKFRKPHISAAPSEYENIDSLGQTHLSEYTESPFKVRKSGITARRAIYGSMKSESKDSLTGEYENINSLSGDTNYVNIDHLLGPCPVATPESLSDTVMLDDIHGPLGRGDKTFNLVNNRHSDIYQDSVFENESLRSQELSRTKSPINTSGFNSAFKPVKGRKSVESPLSRTSSGSDKTYNIENEIDYKTDEFVHSNQEGLVESTDSSPNSGKSSRRQSNISNYVSDVENISSFQWTRDTGMLSMTGLSDSVSRSPRNYLQLAGKAPLNFSVPTFLQDESSSQTSKHSYTDSIPWEESDNSLQTTADLSEGKSGIRQPLKALENTPVFSPIYGQDRRLSIELSSRKRFMSTPKLSTGSELSVSRNSEESKTPQRRRSSGLSKKPYSDNTSTWSSQSETDISCNVSGHSTFALSKTTYI